MDSVRLVGLVVAALFAIYGVRKYAAGKWRRFDLLLVLAISLGVASVSLFPQIGDLPRSVFRLQNRLFALLVFSNLLLLALFMYLLNQVRLNHRRTGDIVRALARRIYQERQAERLYGDWTSEGGAPLGRMLVVIPAYNEEEAIRGVITRIPETILGHQVRSLVVVDGATDATEAVALEHRLPVAPHVVNRGQGDALRTGFEIAQIEGADIVVNLDADGQHQPEEIERLVEPIIKGEADFVMGSRFLGHYEDAGGARHLGIVIFSALISLLSGVRITDCTNGFRAIRVSQLSKLRLQEDRFSTAELILEAAKRKLRIREVPVSILSRAEGESKKPKRLGYPLGFLRVIIQTWLR
ncbi:MAG: glycosyltransferase family 2 protein [Chloroflexota bacterium]|nr:glycosyltransferase family 2 protein [Chloroflexota bacterium]